MRLNGNIEKFMFHMCHDSRMHNAKEELLAQLKHFDVVVDCCGFFSVNRQLISTVSMRHIHTNYRITAHSPMHYVNFFFQSIATAVAYCVMFIQFDIALSAKKPHMSPNTN